MNTKDIEHYLNCILTLPLKENYHKEELLIKELLLDKEDKLKIYYCPHNDYINVNAKILMVGITPGFSQMSKAIATARKCLQENIPLKQIPYYCKIESRFHGTMRKNIISMLDELELNKAMNIRSCVSLFQEMSSLLDTTSVIPYAVFIGEKNYNGHNPKILDNSLLLKYTKICFYSQIKMFKDSLIIPLGKSVEEVLYSLINLGILDKRQCLMGFPHPSGANGHRLTQFMRNKEAMKHIIESYIHKQEISCINSDC
jgi:hypothetical protein